MLLQMLAPPQPFQLLHYPFPGSGSGLPIHGSAYKTITLQLYLKPRTFSRPSRQLFARYVQQPLILADKHHCPSVFESVDYCRLFHLATTNVVSFVTVLPSLLAVTTIRQVPSVVCAPTLHVHETLPAASASFGSNPCALLGPDL